MNVSIKDGKMMMRAKEASGIPNIQLKNVTFMSPMSIEFDMKVTSDEIEEFFVMLFDDPNSVNAYYYIFNCKSREVLTNLVALPTGKRSISLSSLIGTEDCLGTFAKPKLEPGKSYKFKISVRDGAHQISVDNNIVKEIRNDKHNFGEVKIGVSNATIMLDNLKIEGMLEPESTRKMMTGLTSEKQAKASGEGDDEINLGGLVIKIKFKDRSEDITASNILALMDKDRQEEMLNKGLPPSKEAVTKGLEFLKNMPLEDASEADSYFDYVGRAIERFNDATKYDPSFALAYFIKARCYRLMGNLENSIKELGNAIGAAGDFHEAYVDRGELYIYTRQYQTAVKDLDKAIEVKPDYAEAWAQRGYANFGLGNRDKAIADVSKALEIDPDNESAKEYSKNLKNVVKGPTWQKIFSKESKYFVFKTDINQAKCDNYARNLEQIIKHVLRIFSLKEEPLLGNRAEALIFDSEQSYLTYSEISSDGAQGTLGYFHPVYRQLLLFEPPMKEKQTMRVMYHEAFHMVIDRYIQNLPIWFNEGMAEYVGGTDMSSGIVNTGQIQSGRLKNVQKAMECETDENKKYLFPFKQIMNESKSKFYGDQPSLKYAQAWSMVHFFINYQGGQYFNNLKTYFTTLLAGKSPKEAFEKGFGKSDLKQMEKEWRGYVQKLKP